VHHEKQRVENNNFVLPFPLFQHRQKLLFVPKENKPMGGEYNIQIHHNFQLIHLYEQPKKIEEKNHSLRKTSD
jgi:hypothetical protein